MEGFWQMIPRPLTPESGIALGTPHVSDNIHNSHSSKPPTRRGRPLRRGRGSRSDRSTRIAHSPASTDGQADTLIQVEDDTLPEPEPNQRPRKRQYRPHLIAEDNK